MTIKADGDYSYLDTDTIRFSGKNNVGKNTYLFLLGPYLPPSGARLTKPGVAVTTNDPATFDVVSIRSDDNYYCTWEYSWDLSGHDLAGTYTIYAVSAPLDKTHLAAGKYDSISVIIRGPETAMLTKSPTKTVTDTISDTITTTPVVFNTVPAITAGLPTTTPAPTRIKSTMNVPTSWPGTTPTRAEESPLPAGIAGLSLVIGLIIILLRKD